MANTKKKPTDVFEEQLPTLEEFEVQQFFDEITPGVSVVHFHRMYPDGRRPQIGKATLDAIREDVFEYIRTTYIPKYGGGKYMLVARGDASRFLGARTIEVEGDSKVTTPNGPPANGNGQPAGFENLSFQDRLMLFSFLKPQQQQFDMGSMMAGLAAVMTALRPTEAAKPADPIQMFQAIMQMYQGMKDKNEKPPLEQLREVAGVIKEFSADSKGVDSPWGMIAEVGKDAIDKLGPMLSGMGPRPVVAPMSGVGVVRSPAVASPAAALPASTGATPQPASQPAANQAEQNLQAWLVAQLAFFKQRALAGKDPGFWVDYVFENSDEPGCQALLYAMRRGATFENLLAFDPEISQNPQLTVWFREVFEGVKSGLQGDVDSAREGGNTGDTVSDGAASKDGLSGTGGAGVSRAVS